MAIGTAKAAPTKQFFVNTLIRDIALEDCILDLIDNAIDGARESLTRGAAVAGSRGPRKRSGPHPYELKASKRLAAFEIAVHISPERFEITDNCGGISLDDAAERAFTFGRLNQTSDDWSVGVYGIGMKRAVFKLGNDIRVNSTHKDAEGDAISFVVPINVADWLKDESDTWDFEILEADEMDQPGVSITVGDLSVETAERFRDPTYERRLRYTLSRIYMLPLMQGLNIRVNGTPVPSRTMELRSDEAFVPMRSMQVDDGVVVELVAGMLFPPPDDISPEDTSREDRDSGWYVICNGRVVLDADRTTISVWGDNGFPRWHQQYSGFVGIVLFSATDPLLLPMTSTKRGVDVSSALYRRAVARMREPTRAWVDYTNARKLDLQAARQREQQARALDLTKIEPSDEVRLPQPTQVKSVTLANINYALPRARVRKLARALGNINLSYRDVGLRSFEYTYKAEVDEDEGE